MIFLLWIKPTAGGVVPPAPGGTVAAKLVPVRTLVGATAVRGFNA